MKIRIILALLLVLFVSSVVRAASVTPELVDPWRSGDAYKECRDNAGSTCDFAYKIDNNTAGNPTVTTPEGNTITISNSNGYTFDWSSNWPVCLVIVKAGTGAYLYWYSGAYGDTGLSAPSGKEISHVTFCYNKPDMCYEQETAWAQGTRYVTRGNWAMYVKYEGVAKTVNLIADGGDNPTVVGTATFSAPYDGKVDITISLTGGTIFYYDPIDPYRDNNIKIQDYASKPPAKNPSPGLFAWKWAAPVGQTTVTVTVPRNNYYGVHLDVAIPVPCQ